MRAVIQRVAQASVCCSGSGTSSIERGLCILLGIESTDSNTDSQTLINKILDLKLFPSSNENNNNNSNSDDNQNGAGESSNGTTKRWARSVRDIEGEVLVISQFTLHATYKGKKPSFHRAMGPEKARGMFYEFVEQMRKEYVVEKVKNCVFGSYMSVELVNDGPVTVIVDTKNLRGG